MRKFPQWRRRRISRRTVGGVVIYERPLFAKGFLICGEVGVCSHLSGLCVRFMLTAGPDGIRGPTPHHVSELEARTTPRVGPIPVTLFRHHIITTFAILARPGGGLAGGLPVGLESLVARKHGPDDTSGLVGQGNQHNVRRPAREQGLEPVRARLLATPGPEQHDAGAVDEEPSEIAVTALRDAAKPVLAATR